MIWWVWGKLSLALPSWDSTQPVRVALGAFAVAVFISYAIANSRGLPPDEVSPSDSALLRLLSWAGVALVAHDGILEREQLERLLARLVLFGGLFACLGLAQFASGSSLIDAIQIPGFSVDLSSGVQVRSGFTRSSATATHPLEYAVILSATLSIALALALNSRQRSHWRRLWAPVAISLAAVLSVSRSALVGIVIGVAVFLPVLSARIRMAFMGAGAILAVVVYVAVPGIAGTVRGLFLGLGDDPSVESRINSYPVANEFLGHQPIFGRGLGTFLPKYQIFDNQILQALVEVGVVGVAALLAVAACAIAESQKARRRATLEGDTYTAQALTAAVAATAFLFFFFDALSFPMAAGFPFLLAGLSGAASRLLVPLREPRFVVA
jgi:O-antigen ligase